MYILMIYHISVPPKWLMLTQEDGCAANSRQKHDAHATDKAAHSTARLHEEVIVLIAPCRCVLLPYVMRDAPPRV